MKKKEYRVYIEAATHKKKQKSSGLQLYTVDYTISEVENHPKSYRVVKKIYRLRRTYSI